MTDSRIADFTQEFFASYEVKYKIKPNWSGKQADHVKRLWKTADRNNLTEEEVYIVLGDYFTSQDPFVEKVKHDCVYFCNNFDKFYLAYKEKSVRKVFAPPVKNMDETLKVNPVNDRDITSVISSRYSPESFVKMMRFHACLDGVQAKQGRLYEHYKRWWLIGYELWGKERLKALWDKKEPVVTIQDQIKQAKVIEAMPHDQYIDQLKKALEIERGMK